MPKSKKPGLALVPPAARAMSPAKQDEQILSAHAVASFVDALGGRERFTTILSTGSDDPDVEVVLNYLLDPKFADFSLVKICALARLSVADLFKAFAKATELRNRVQAASQIDSELPKIVADLLRRAQPHEEECSSCLGQKTVPAAKAGQPDVPCLTCRGRGTLKVTPSLDHQKLVLELADLLKKGGGISVQQNNIAASVGGRPTAGLLERMQQVVSDTLYGHAAEPAIDAVPVPPEAPDPSA